MRRIGIIGGLGPEATIDYYRIITGSYRERLEDGSYPEIIIFSMNMNEFLNMAEAGEWDKALKWLSGGIESLHGAGADFAIIAACTPHIIFREVEAAAPMPVLSIVEETLKVADELGLKKVGLFGTKFTMRSDFFQRVFSRKDIEVAVPDGEEQEHIHDKIAGEIALGRIMEETRIGLLGIVRRMIDSASIDGLILGCTELPLILTGDEFGIPFINTTKVHAESAVRYCLSGA